MTYVKFNGRPLNKTLPNVVDDLIQGLPAWFDDAAVNFSRVPVNIKETREAFMLELVAPGFEKGDFKINVEGNILTISAEKSELKKQGENQPEEKQIRQEYKYRNFKSSFTIDEKTDATSIDASYVNGVLLLNLPKKAEVKEVAKEIKVK